MLIRIRGVKDGPLLLEIEGKVVGAFCRCGHSGDRFRCDGTHRKIGFKAEERCVEYGGTSVGECG